MTHVPKVIYSPESIAKLARTPQGVELLAFLTRDMKDLMRIQETLPELEDQVRDQINRGESLKRSIASFEAQLMRMLVPDLENAR